MIGILKEAKNPATYKKWDRAKSKGKATSEENIVWKSP